MPFPNIELPADFDVPRINPKPRDKRLDNLRPGGPGRPKGALDKISRDLKNGILDAAIAHGRDGSGADGLQGYLYLLASENRKTFAGLLARILPYNVSATASTQSISEVRILSIPSGTHLNREELAKLQEPASHVIEHVTQHETPALEPIEAPTPEPAAIDQDFKPQTERERQLLAELEALSPEELLERAKQVGYFDVADGN